MWTRLLWGTSQYRRPFVGASGAFCDRASIGQSAVSKSHRKCSVAGCRIGATPLVVGAVVVRTACEKEYRNVEGLSQSCLCHWMAR